MNSISFLQALSPFFVFLLVGPFKANGAAHDSVSTLGIPANSASPSDAEIILRKGSNLRTKLVLPKAVPMPVAALPELRRDVEEPGKLRSLSDPEIVLRSTSDVGENSVDDSALQSKIALTRRYADSELKMSDSSQDPEIVLKRKRAESKMSESSQDPEIVLKRKRAESKMSDSSQEPEIVLKRKTAVSKIASQMAVLQPKILPRRSRHYLELSARSFTSPVDPKIVLENSGKDSGMAAQKVASQPNIVLQKDRREFEISQNPASKSEPTSVLDSNASG